MSVVARNSLQEKTSGPSQNELIGQTENIRLSMITDQPGIVEFRGSTSVVLSLHIGPSVAVDCRRAGERHRGTTIHGDLEIIPPNLGGVWEIKSIDTALIIGIKFPVLERVLEEFGDDPAKLQVINRFQSRDSQIEYIAWALKAEMESGYPCGRIYRDSLATALAARIVRNHSSLARPSRVLRSVLPTRKLKEVLAYVEDNLSRDLELREIADVAGLSVSHFKTIFRQSVGMPPHQYLIRRRVEPAATQLRKTKAPIGQIALENGFCHQSHLALHIRRILGVSPQQLRDAS